MNGAPHPLDLATLRERVRAVMPAVRSALDELVRIPSISSQPERADAVAESAAAVARLLGTAGVRAEVVAAAGGAPAVIGAIPAPPGRPTVLLYAHHDVQPEGARELWCYDPFEPVEREGRLHGRGAADDKGGIAVHLGALLALGDSLDVGVTVLIEGEEEIGSPTLGAFLAEHGDRLAADLVVVTDAINRAPGEPSLTTSLRGLLALDVTVEVLEAPVHSGVHGGPVPDALVALAHLLASLHRPDGTIAVDGLSGCADAALEGPDAERFRSEAGVLPGVRLRDDRPVAEQLWRDSALSVLAIDAPPSTAAANVLVPAATARLSLRLAPGIAGVVASSALREHLLARAPFGARATVRELQRVEPFLLEAGGAGHSAAAAALGEAWGRPAAIMGGGGGIPAVSALAACFPGAQIVVTGVADPTSSVHGPQESVDLDDLERAIVAEALLLLAPLG